MEIERFPADPRALVVVGATGGLARKLLPAVYNLAHDGVLPESWSPVGVVPSDHRLENFVARTPHRSIAFAALARSRLARRPPAELRYVSGSLEDGEVYAQSQRTLGSVDEHAGREPNRIFALATVRVLPAARGVGTGDGRAGREPAARSTYARPGVTRWEFSHWRSCS